MKRLVPIAACMLLVTPVVAHAKDTSLKAYFSENLEAGCIEELKTDTAFNLLMKAMKAPEGYNEIYCKCVSQNVNAELTEQDILAIADAEGDALPKSAEAIIEKHSDACMDKLIP